MAMDILTSDFLEDENGEREKLMKISRFADKFPEIEGVFLLTQPWKEAITVYKV